LATDTEGESTPARSAGRPRQRTQRPQRRRYSRRRTRKKCAFCDDDSLPIDYKKANSLQNYLTDRGKILPRRATGTCARHQRRVAVAIKRARHLALLPFTADHMRSG
jgi:small subunit ribosomal protein S18